MSVLVPESLSLPPHSTLVASVETSMDGEVGPLQNPGSVKNTTVSSSLSVQAHDDDEDVPIGSPGKRVAKRYRVESDLEVGDDGGKKEGKKKKVKKPSGREITTTENFTVDGRLTVILTVDETIRSVDLRAQTVSALAAVDFDMVPFLKNAVSYL